MHVRCLLNSQSNPRKYFLYQREHGGVEKLSTNGSQLVTRVTGSCPQVNSRAHGDSHQYIWNINGVCGGQPPLNQQACHQKAI